MNLMPDDAVWFNHTSGTTTTEPWESRQRYLAACEEALHRIWEVSGCFRVEDAEPVLLGVHEIAQSVLHPDPPAD